MAPGVSITSAAAGGGYRTEDGTSAASAFVAGTALLMLDVHPGLAPADLAAELMGTAVDWGGAGPDGDFGAGRLDGYAALQAAGAPLHQPPAAPEHQSLAGTLSDEGLEATHTIEVSSDQAPLALTLTSLNDADLDLRLDGPNGQHWSATTPDARDEVLSVPTPSAGTYTVHVTAYRGSGDYELDVSSAAAASGGGQTPGGQDNGNAQSPSPASAVTWHATYDWPAGHGSAGWSTATTVADPDAYGFAGALPVFGDTPGLAVWPTGDREYRPGRAEWRYRAPGSTRIVASHMELAYRDKLLAHHCIGAGLRDRTGTGPAQGTCTPAEAPAPGRFDADLTAAPEATEAWLGIDMPACQNPRDTACSKWIPALDPVKNGPLARATSADLTLVDDDAPGVSADGTLFDLRNHFTDGRGQYTLHISGSDPGAGMRRVTAQRLGDGDPLLSVDAACDPMHRTAALAARICSDHAETTADIDGARLPEGTDRIDVTAEDYVGHTSAPVAWELYVDRTAPETPGFAWAQSNPDVGGATLEWDESPDPDLPDGHPGSGLKEYAYRYAAAGQPMPDWATTTDSSVDVPGVLGGTTLDVEIAAIDELGNRSEQASFNLVVDGLTPDPDPRAAAWDLSLPDYTDEDLGAPDTTDYCEPFEVPGVFTDDCSGPNPAMRDAAVEPALSAQYVSSGRSGGFGISDQLGDHRGRSEFTPQTTPSTAAGFLSPEFRNLAIGKARITIPYDLMDRPSGDRERMRFNRWMAATKAARLERLISFEKRREDNVAPSLSAYYAAVSKFVARYSRLSTSQYFVKYYTAWNEPNNRAQPPHNRADLAAGYFRAVNHLCSHRACAVAAGDFLDSATDSNHEYVAQYRNALKMRPRLWAWHPYRDVKLGEHGRLDRFLKATACSGCPSSQVWLTEGNGVSALPPNAPDGPMSYSQDGDTAAALDHMIDLADDPDRPRVKRVYVYQWMGGDGTNWDSGLFRLDGSCRPTYNVLRRKSNPAGRDLPCPTKTVPAPKPPDPAP